MEFVQEEGFIMATTTNASNGKEGNNIDVVVDVMVLHYNICNFLRAFKMMSSNLYALALRLEFRTLGTML
jgi:hypothetical protein